jgi:rod shape-determining protein MreC
MLHQSKRAIVSLAGILFFISIVSSAYTRNNSSFGRAGAEALSLFTNPVYKCFVNLERSLTSWFKKHNNLVDVKEENSTLKLRLASLKTRILHYQEQARENNRLRNLLAIPKTRNDLAGVVAEVVSYDKSSLFSTILIDKGSSSGIKEGMAVINADGVVGQTTVVTPFSTRVLLITDQRSEVDARIEDSRVRGIVRGRNTSNCDVNFISAEIPVEQSSKILTTGMDEVFPEGLLLGRVSRVGKVKGLFRELEMQPATLFSALEEVLVVSVNK